MKKLTIITSALLAANAAIAASAPKDAASNFTLYQTNNNSAAIVAKLSPTTQLVKIYTDPKNSNWVKVGIRQNGQVGWIKRDQYKAALTKFNTPDIQTFYVSSTSTDKSGKPKINIVAYKNGKKISDQDAQKLYKKLQLQQQLERSQMQQLDANMNKMLNAAFRPIMLGTPVIISNNNDS